MARGVHPTDVDPEPSDRALVFTGERPRNVLMISIDTLRRDHVDRYATDGVTRMPFLSSLLQTGVALDDHQQCGDWTFHSMTCTLLGRQTEEIGWVARPTGADSTPLPDQPLLAVRLDDAGYQSLLASTTGWLEEEWNNTRGYQPDLAHGVVQATEVMDVALEGLAAALDTAPAKPWFLHVHLVEPHAAYDPPEAYRAEVDALPPIPWDLDDHVEQYAADGAWPDLTPEMQELLDRHLQARYDGECRWLDDQLAVVWQRLESEGLLDHTLVVLYTDHGEAFWEHGVQSHAHFLQAEENDGILWFWSQTMVSRAWTGPTTAIDLVPTVLDALGLPVPDDGTLPGSVLGQAPRDRARFSSTAAREGGLDAIDRLGIRDDTLVFWCADNGAEARRPWRGSPGPWSGFYNSAMEGGIRTPCIVRWPGHIPAGRTTDELVHEIDVFPTIAHAVGADLLPHDRPIDGVDQLPFLMGEQEHSSRDSVLIYNMRKVGQPWAAKWHDWKLHYAFQPEPSRDPPADPQLRLFDLRSDPREEFDVKDANPWVVGVVDQLFADFEATAVAHPHVPPGAPDPYVPPGGR